MNILEFRHFEPNLKKLIQAGTHKQLAVERIDREALSKLDQILEEEAKLGKREPARSIDEITSEFKNMDFIKNFIAERQKNDLEEELFYMRDFRVKTELWKKFMVRRNPSKVSFVVHNVDYVAERYFFLTEEYCK